ncbi:MAG: thioesterase family protein [Gaiellaceae bacterium]|jgi:acyl-CoA thioester hydrolase
MSAYKFSTEITVRFSETDAGGIAHHSSYVIWFEVARVAYLAEYAGGYQLLRDQGIESPLVELNVRYLVPARFDDRLRVYVRCTDVRGARFRCQYLIERDGERLAEGSSLHALVDARTLRPTRMPAWLKDAIHKAESKGMSG